MNEILNRNINRAVSEVSPMDMKILIAGFIDEANKVMGRSADDRDVMWLVEWTTRYLSDRYGYIPIHHVRAAIEYGALGERGGTIKLMPRNIAIWIREQSGIMQDINAKRISADEEKQRIQNFNSNKAEWQVAAAVRIKVSWLGDGLITAEEYDSFSSKEIYDFLKMGIPEGKIHPRDIVPDYEKHRAEVRPDLL